jgi:hypothetical protein
LLASFVHYHHRRYILVLSFLGEIGLESLAGHVLRSITLPGAGNSKVASPPRPRIEEAVCFSMYHYLYNFSPRKDLRFQRRGQRSGDLLSSKGVTRVCSGRDSVCSERLLLRCDEHSTSSCYLCVLECDGSDRPKLSDNGRLQPQHGNTALRE